MMKSPTSLIRFRNAVGVMLAMSAIFAVVVSTISMPGDRAFGQTATMTNSEKVQAALDAFEDALVDPDRNTPAIRLTQPPTLTARSLCYSVLWLRSLHHIQPDADSMTAPRDRTTAGTMTRFFAIEVDNPTAADGGSGETGARR